MKTLKYGNPPDVAQCVDLGVVPMEAVPKEVRNEGIFSGEMSTYEMIGYKVPPYRRALLAIAYFRGKDVITPWRCEVPGLGTLVYHDVDPDYPQFGSSDNWEVL